MAAFGAQVIRVEDPVLEGRWDILRGARPHVDERRGIETGGGFQNHNVGKLGITLDVRTERGKELFRELVRVSDVVAENFAAGVLERWGFGYDVLRSIRPDIVYVSNCGFGHEGPYGSYRTWGPIVQACCGLTFFSGLADQPPAGWGYSYMDHHGANFMALAIMLALVHRGRTGEGQWVDMSCTEAGAALLGPALLDFTVNRRLTRRPGSPDTNRSESPRMAPHGIYRCAGDDEWVAVACPSDEAWAALADVLGADDPRFETVDGRMADQDELDDLVRAWTTSRTKRDAAAQLQAVGVPAAPVQKPAERIDDDPDTAQWGLWPAVEHPVMGRLRVDGLPVHLEATDWRIAEPAPLLGQHNDVVYGTVLGLSPSEIDDLRAERII